MVGETNAGWDEQKLRYWLIIVNSDEAKAAYNYINNLGDDLV